MRQVSVHVIRTITDGMKESYHREVTVINDDNENECYKFDCQAERSLVMKTMGKAKRIENAARKGMSTKKLDEMYDFLYYGKKQEKDNV